MRQQNCEVSLKDKSGLVVGKGILLSEIQTGDDVGGLTLFPHQVAVRIVEVFTCANENQIEDGQVLKTCLGEIVRWSRSAVHTIDNVPARTTPSIPTKQEFDFEDDMCNPNKNSTERRTESMHQHLGQEETPEELNRVGADVSATTFTVFGVDGLAPRVSKRKYCKTKRGGQPRGDCKIGTSRAQKVSLARVQNDMESSLCSKGCLKKLSAGAVLMKRYRAWGSNKYEERASWILENLMEYYSEETDKFETKVCG